MEFFTKFFQILFIFIIVYCNYFSSCTSHSCYRNQILEIDKTFRPSTLSSCNKSYFDYHKNFNMNIPSYSYKSSPTLFFLKMKNKNVKCDAIKKNFFDSIRNFFNHFFLINANDTKSSSSMNHGAIDSEQTIKESAPDPLREFSNTKKLDELGNSDKLNSAINNGTVSIFQKNHKIKNLGTKFYENNFFTILKKRFSKAPPITLSYIALSFAVGLYSFLYNDNMIPDSFIYDFDKVFLKKEFWRIFTCFLHFSKFDLQFFLSLQFIYTYMSNLERLHYKNPEKFLEILLFGMVSIAGFYPFLVRIINNAYLENFSTKTTADWEKFFKFIKSFGVKKSQDSLSNHVSPAGSNYSVDDDDTKLLSEDFDQMINGGTLSTFFVYIWSRVFQGDDINVFDLFTVKTEFIPFIMILQSYLIHPSNLQFVDFFAIFMGIIYNFFGYKKNIVITKLFLRPILRSKFFQNLYSRYQTNK